MNNRLKLLRKVMGKTQADIARIVGVTQNAYSYWERGAVKIHNESLVALADYYKVSVDFLLGKPFSARIPPEKWSAELKAQYDSADENTRIYMEYVHGNESKKSEVNEISPAKPKDTSLNTIIYHRDGKEEQAVLTPSQMKLFFAMLDMNSEKDSDDGKN